MTRYLLLLFTVAIGALALAFTLPGEETRAEPAPLAASAAASPVVVELFTSQGCSSCPPADALASRLAGEKGVLVLSRPVTYWDRLGWKDTLAHQDNTDLQRAYARRGLGGRNGVYTPQAVVDGRSGVVGSRERDLRALIAAASRRERPVIEVAGGEVAVSGDAGGAATLSLVGFDRSETVAITRGENASRSVSYTNIWKGERALGRWTGGAARFALPNTRIAGADSHALLLRRGEDGPVLAAHIL